MMPSFRRHRAWIIGLALFASCFWFLAAHGVHAQGVTSNELLPTSVGTAIGTGTTDIRITIARVIRVALGLLGTVALLLVLYAGFLWMTASGDEDKIARAKKTLTGAVIGLAIILSAFAITQFVLNALVSATTQGEVTGPGGGGGGGGLGGGGNGGAFRPTGIQPKGSLRKYDVVASVTFNAAPTGDAANIKANVLLEKVAGGARTPVDYDPIVQNDTIRLQPVQACPPPNGGKRCLEPNQEYQVTVRAGLKNASSSDPRTVNCGIGANCTQAFKTGSVVGTGSPTVSIASPLDGASVPAGDLIALQSISTDQDGIATVEYSADGAFFASDGAAQRVAASTYSSQVFWDDAAFVPVKRVTLTARATNIDGDSADSAPVHVTVRPAACFDHVKDGDEVGVDCGGSCGACTGAACTSDASCSSGQCRNGVCVENPQITDVQLRDGKPGNLVTITGLHFGSQPGTVTFLGASAAGDEKSAPLASCGGAWSDTRVVIAVPSGAVTGPIQVAVAGGAKKDATNDAFGPIIADFQVNDTARPGICSVAPASVKTGLPMTVTGLAFGAAQGDSRIQLARAASDCSQIQDWSSAAEVPQVPSWSDTSVRPVMPNVDTGSDGAQYLMRVTVGGQPSNVACVRAEPPSAGTEPHIDLITPDSGSVGTYVSLLGSNFGTGGTVRFRNAAGEAIGDVSFPAQCAAGYWTDSSVTVKVPAKFTTPADTPVALNPPYDVTVVRSDGRSSNARPFVIDTAPVPPGICRIDPDNGPAGSAVTLYGENFGDIAANDLPSFSALHPDAVSFHDHKPASSIGQWGSSGIKAVVPDGALTGPAVIKTYSGSAALASNGINFRVSDCRQAGGDAACGNGRACCGDGSCRASCGGSSAIGGYAWKFSTGPIPVFPVVIENATCQVSAPTSMPSPNPFKSAQDVCTDIGAIAVRFSLPMDPATFHSGNVVLESCGTGTSVSGTCTTVAGVGTPSAVPYDPEGRTELKLPIGGLQPGTWYRLTLKDRILSLGSPDRAAQPLDGNSDGKAGGAYVTTFKTGSAPCALSGVHVDPASGLISAADAQEAYAAFPLSNRCIILSCAGRSVSWSSSDTSKAVVAPLGGTDQCEALASPVSETDPGPPVHIKAAVDGKSDQGDLTIDYANPRIVEYGPRDCNAACINGVAFAYFNTPMATSGAGSVLDADNVMMYACRNESCLAFSGQVPISPRYDSASRLLTFGNPNLNADTFYRVVVSGRVLSTSQAPLTGLNYGNDAFSWIFRTRTDANPCGPQKVTIEPAQTTLRYIGQVAPVTALPLSSPDACAAKGEILNAASYNWAWTKAQTPADPPAFRFLPDTPPGTLLNTNPNLPAGCSSSCLMTGSQPPGTPACGNGVLEKGEACDTPGLNGCNANCQRTGNTAANGCGDGAVQPDRGEECDSGTANGTTASGCTTACLLAGSSAGLSACGNGSVGVGEACDDGNTANGDGCSSSCLLEGSRQNVYVCGNGKIEPGEECDYQIGSNGLATNLLLPDHAPIALSSSDERNPTKPAFACSSSCLLRGNAASCVSGSGCCGNGHIDYAKGENCDAGSENGQAASGCSSVCTKTGAAPALHAFCGDTFLTVKPFDVLTGAENGGGEECEALALDANIDAAQAVEARSQCDAANSCTASVTATVGTVSGQGSVRVECSCRNDGDCAGFGTGLSCGAGACCYQRPAAPDIAPKGGNECRNAQISVTFGEEMDVGSLQGNLIVEACGPVAFHDAGGSWLARIGRAIGSFFRSIVGTVASAAGNCAPVEGAFKHLKDVTPTGTRTVSVFAPKQAFDPKRTYRVTVKSGPNGAKSLKGVGYPQGSDAVQEFGTGSDICRLDSVQVSPASGLLQTSSEPLTLVATAMTSRDGRFQPIAPVPGTYDWTWSWATVPEATPPGSILTLTSSDAPAASVQALKATNGQEQVLAAATIGSDTLFSPSTAATRKIGTSDITVMLCERPWPARDPLTGAWAPYVDPATHFEFSYCRDEAAAPLPELQALPVQGQSGAGGDLLRFCRTTREGGQPKACFSDADCGAGDACLSKDLFFQFKPETKLADAIGVRVYNDADRLPPQQWYRARFSGTTQAAVVDGYQAVKDAHTVYVGAADKYGDPILRSYVYVFAFNDKADPRTSEVFDRLIKNVRFNTNLSPAGKAVDVCKDGTDGLVSSTSGAVTPIACSSDLDCFRAVSAPTAGLHCDSDKQKIRRDLRRWQDIRDIETSLEQTHTATGFYPKLESGSFVRAFTTSKWPSWSQQMGAAGAIVDPLNDFNRCDAFGSECSVSGKACASDRDCAGGTGDVCRPVFEAATCFDERAGVFACPAASHVYQYRSIGGVDYRMSVDLEYVAAPWSGADCSTRADADACGAAIGCSWLPTGPASGICQTRVTVTPACSGLPGAAGKCLKTGTACTDSSQCGAQDHCVPSSVPLVGPASSASCGNGLLEANEECEVGQQKNVACAAGGTDAERCDASCHWQVTQACPGAAACGNGSVERYAGESCDDGAQNGQYGRCRSGSLGCAKRCIKIAPRVSFDGNCADGSCDLGPVCASNADCENLGYQATCTDRMNFCGDGVRNGPEACDDGARNGEYGSCAWDCSGPGPRCGDNVTNGGEQCDGDRRESAGVCVPSGSTLADGATMSGSAASCSKDSDCGSGMTCAVCGMTSGGLPQTRSKSCYPASAPGDSACTFGDWSVCRQSGACGNGKVEGSEECDAGSANSPTGACLPNCKKNVCNDGSVLSGVEQCDNGAANGVLCTPQYGLTCNYCKTDCSIETVSGAFCGDKTLQSPPESCDPGPVSAWCSRTYADPSDPSHVKACASDKDCLPGVCKNYPNTSSPATEGAPCRSASDCTAFQFCQGGEGQCTPYNVQCRPEPYSNTRAASNAPNYFDGSCVSCTSACGSTPGKSPSFCGDSVVQKQFGEQCEDVGDPNATGPSGSKSYYACSGDCSYDVASGFCGDGKVQPGTVERCDGNDFSSGADMGSAPTCLSQNWGSAGTVACGNNCGYYGGGCSDGPLSPGDVRIRVTWKNPPDVKDIDTHVKLPVSGASQEIYYSNKGTVIQDPHVWLSWDDTGASQGDNAARDGFAAPYGLEITTINWRSNGAYWPSSAADPYKIFLYQWTAGNDGMKGTKVTICTYDASKTGNADCSRVFTASANGGNRFWHVFDLSGGADAVPTITPVDQFSSSTP